jgi:hypothetical protein
MTCTVIASDPGREFAFTVAGPGGKTINTWRYQPGPGPQGTEVTESFELSDTLLTCMYWTLAGRALAHQPGRHACHRGEDQGGRRIRGFFRLAGRTGSAPG